jgi:HSP20 family protein
MTTLTRYEPLREMTNLSRAMDRMFDRFMDESFFDMPTMWQRGNGGGNSLALDVVEQDDKFVVKASVPGINPEDIEVTLNEGVLTIKGETKGDHEVKEENYHLRERHYGSFLRRVALPTNIDADKVEATNENGVLTLTLPKAEEVKPRRIEVKKMVESKATSQ